MHSIRVYGKVAKLGLWFCKIKSDNDVVMVFSFMHIWKVFRMLIWQSSDQLLDVTIFVVLYYFVSLYLQCSTIVTPGKTGSDQDGAHLPAAYWRHTCVFLRQL